MGSVTEEKKERDVLNSCFSLADFFRFYENSHVNLRVGPASLEEACASEGPQCFDAALASWETHLDFSVAVLGIDYKAVL